MNKDMLGCKMYLNQLNAKRFDEKYSKQILKIVYEMLYYEISDKKIKEAIQITDEELMEIKIVFKSCEQDKILNEKMKYLFLEIEETKRIQLYKKALYRNLEEVMNKRNKEDSQTFLAQKKLMIKHLSIYTEKRIVMDDNNSLIWDFKTGMLSRKEIERRQILENMFNEIFFSPESQYLPDCQCSKESHHTFERQYSNEDRNKESDDKVIDKITDYIIEYIFDEYGSLN